MVGPVWTGPLYPCRYHVDRRGVVVGSTAPQDGQRFTIIGRSALSVM
jgi:hypothetical protein